MDGVKLTVSESHSLLHGFEMSMAAHEGFLASVFRVFVCGDDLKAEHISDDAHLKCQFGVWMAQLCAKDHVLEKSHLINDIDFIHRRFHDSVRNLFLVHKMPGADRSAIAHAYEEVMVKMNALRWTVRTLDHQVCHRILNLDPMTCVFGRDKLESTIQREIDEVRRDPKRETLVVMFDIDHFKKVNDTYGHTVGDAVLIGVAKYMQAVLRPTDLIFRYGGEEFVLFLPNAAKDSAFVLIDRVRLLLSSHAIPTSAAGGQIHVTASFGGTHVLPTDSVTCLIERADEAMYQAKRQGRNRVVVA